MSGLLKLTAIGHASTNDPNKITNLVVADLPEVAHITAPDHAAHTVIDEGMHLENQVVKDVSVVPSVVVSRSSNAKTAVSHTWQNDVVNVNPIDHIAIPWQHGD